MQSQIEAQINLQKKLNELQDKMDLMSIELNKVDSMKATQLSQIQSISEIQAIKSDLELIYSNVLSTLSQREACEYSISVALTQIQSFIDRYPNVFSRE